MKKLLLPFQTVLLSRKMCPGCTMPLEKATVKIPFRDRKVMVQCKCKRKYVLDEDSLVYKRMTLDEERELFQKMRK